MSHFEEYFIAAQYSILPERERDILDLRYGFGDGDPRTLQEIGTIHGITRERVRQLIDRALRKLRIKGYRELKKGEADHPCAQLITYLRDQVNVSGMNEDEAILDFIERELAYLPIKTHSIQLIAFLFIEEFNEIKPRATLLNKQYQAGLRAKRYARKQVFELNSLLEHVIWFEKVNEWDVKQFEGLQPQQSGIERDEVSQVILRV